MAAAAAAATTITVIVGLQVPPHHKFYGRVAQ